MVCSSCYEEAVSELNAGRSKEDVSRPVGRGGAGGCMCTPFFSLIIACHFTEVLNVTVVH